MTTKIVTPAGRVVWGNPQLARDKEKNGQKVVKDGKVVQEYTFGLAVPKAEFAALAAAMQAEAAAACPQGIPADFAYKIKDGDTGVDKNGGPLNVKPGYAGCYVLSCSTEYPIPVFKREGANFVQMVGGVKTGDFIRAELTINGHGRAPGVTGSKPGLYLNPNMCEFLGYGEEIRGGANPNDAFGQAVAAPAGASATPLASGPMPSAPAAPGPFGGAPQAPQPAAPAAPVAPHTGFPWGGNG